MDESNRRPPDVHLDFGHDLAAPRDVRAELQRLLDDPDDPIADAVSLVASELVSNVVIHTGEGGTIDVWDPRPDVPLRLEVSDNDPSTLAEKRAPEDHTGRGLRIVEQLADAWGVTTRGIKKVVWAEFDRIRRKRSLGQIE
jgi:anti-sigma regulatory factor (Ser/Thr protein kinase)